MMKIHRLVLPTVLGIALAIALLAAAVRQSHAALEPKSGPMSPLPPSALMTREAVSPQAIIRYVATSGTDSSACTDSANPCRSVQYAVDQAVEGDEVRVASGVYSDIHIRPRQDITITGFVTQVVFISKTISIRGGYTLTNWTTPDPENNPTILDAQGQGRVVYITGMISTTLEGLHLTGGDATGLGGFVFDSSNYDAGGGIYINGASINLQKCRVSENYTPDYGGGVFLFNSQALIHNNKIYSNRTWGHGGGLSSIEGNIALVSNLIATNSADTGGGLYMLDGIAGIQNNLFKFTLDGGAAYLDSVSYTINNNQFQNNSAHTYNGTILQLQGGRGKISRNIFSSNTGSGVLLISGTALIEGNLITKQGGTILQATGIQLNTGSYTLTNNMVVQNSIEEFTGISVISATAVLVHNTIAQDINQHDDNGLVISNGSIVNMINNIIAAQYVGISVYSSTVEMEATLWGSGYWANDTDWSITNSIFSTGTVSLWGDPGFTVIGPLGDFHITPDSASIDAGVETGVNKDYDGEMRPNGLAVDIGADELYKTIRYVTPNGFDISNCSISTYPCRTVQYAVDQAVEGDEVRVASGVYSDIHIRPRQDITTTGYVTQVVYISKTISIQGGYTMTNWITPDPEANPTVLDAQGQGRVVYITGLVSPTIEGIVITHGDSINQGGWYIPGLMTDQDVGGGLYIITASATISNCEISLNSSPDYGGGVVLVYSSVRLQRNNINTNNASAGGGIASFLGYNSVISNTISNNTGGGMYLGGEYGLQSGNEQVVKNLISENSGSLGAGILLWYAPPATLSGNTLSDNYANQGGGVYSFYSDPILYDNRILANQANWGGGLYLLQYYGVMDSNVVASNTADSTGGFYLDGGAPIIINNIFTHNHSESYGSGMSIDISHSARLMNNTIANNTGGYGMGITVMSNSQIVLTNTIITSQSIGIYVPGGNNQNTVVMEGTLWGSGAWANGQDWAGGGPIYTGTVNVWGDPGFVNPENGDYHISYGSAAIDAGIDAGVYTDIDGEPRPAGAGFDIGADELQAALSLGLSASPDPVASGGNLTYTLILTNTGGVELNAIITATFPAQVAPGGSLTWSVDLPAGGDPWTESVIVVLDPSYAGPLTSTLKAVSLEGARVVVTNTVTAVQPVLGLAALNSSPTRLGQPTTFTATLATGSEVWFEWNFGDGTSGAGQSVEHTYPSSGVYTATVTASNAVSDQSAQTILIVEETIAGLSVAASSPTVLGQTTVLTAAVTAGSNVSYTWDFGDGASGTGTQATHTYTTAGEYTATVTAYNLVSQVTESITLTVIQPGYNLFLPQTMKAY
jgi:PKD repeat protein